MDVLCLYKELNVSLSFILHRNWPKPNSHRPPFDGSASEFGVFGLHWGRAEVAFDTLPAETGQFECRCPSYTAARRLALFTKCAFLKKYSLGSPQNRVPQLLSLVRIRILQRHRQLPIDGSQARDFLEEFCARRSFVILRSVMVCSPFLVWFLVASAGATLAPAESGLRKRHGGSASGPGHPPRGQA
jgi:hypothetical protein